MEMGEPGTAGCGDQPPLPQELTAPGGTGRGAKGTRGTSRNTEGRAGLQAGGQNWTSGKLGIGAGLEGSAGLEGLGWGVRGGVSASRAQSGQSSVTRREGDAGL